MAKNINTEIKRLELEAAKLEKQRLSLLKQQDKEEKQLKKLDSIVERSGYKNAKQLIEALMVRNKIAPSQLNKKAAKGTGRTRTTVTAKLRDKIRASLKSGMTKTAIGEKFGISYLVVRGVENGKYDKLA
ncbi:MAG: hypothetical protein AAGJ81_01695 [Verrucomicrobiota bacterium]